MMNASTRIVDLSVMHPRLLWAEIGAAAVAVLSNQHTATHFNFDLSIQGCAGFDDDLLRLTVDASGIAENHVERMRRTFEPHRLVELAAIAITGLALYDTGRHEIRDVALRGSGADYIVDEANDVLEIAGRSRKADFSAAWQQKWQRLSDRAQGGFYLCIVEFESLSGRLWFRD